jgi:hypothetical protein
VAKFPLSLLLSHQYCKRRRRLLGVKLSKMLLEFLVLLSHERCMLRHHLLNKPRQRKPLIVAWSSIIGTRRGLLLLLFPLPQQLPRQLILLPLFLQNLRVKPLVS